MLCCFEGVNELKTFFRFIFFFHHQIVLTQISHDKSNSLCFLAFFLMKRIELEVKTMYCYKKVRNLTHIKWEKANLFAAVLEERQTHLAESVV